jgi:hypothetical protein
VVAVKMRDEDRVDARRYQIGAFHRGEHAGPALQHNLPAVVSSM